MFIFLRLLLAHLIGDFPLQIGSVYSAKVKNLQGKVIHVGIIAVTMTILMWPFWKSPYAWVVILLNAIGHYLQDWAKLAIIQRIKNSNNFFLFLADQVLHITTLCIVWLTPLAHESPTPKNLSFLSWFYHDDRMILATIFILTVSFAGTFILATFKSTFLPPKLYTPYLNPLEKTYGILERTLMMGLLFASPYFVLTLPLFLILKLLYANFQIKRLKGNTFEPFMIDTVLSIFLVLTVYIMYCVLS